jgi:hypothetical protein
MIYDDFVYYVKKRYGMLRKEDTRKNPPNPTKLRRPKKFKQLVEYRGGGYNGCYWEWNIGVLLYEGTFVPIFSSGSDGIYTQEQWIKFKPSRYTTLYNNTKKGLCEFTRRASIDLVTSIAPVILELFDLDLPVYCEKCERLIVISDIDLDIARVKRVFVCEDCASEGICEYCGDLATDEGLSNVIINGNELLVCESCYSDVLCRICDKHKEGLISWYFDPNWGQYTLFDYRELPEYRELFPKAINICVCPDCSNLLNECKGDLTKIYEVLRS